MVTATTCATLQQRTTNTIYTNDVVDDSSLTKLEEHASSYNFENIGSGGYDVVPLTTTKGSENNIGDCLARITKYTR
eukprot:4787635-Amphidinium_carterae.1